MRNYIILLLTLLIAGCGNQPSNAEEWPIKPKNKIAVRLIELDSINRAVMGSPEEQRSAAMELKGDQSDEYASSLRQRQDSDEMVWHTFIRLCNEEKFKEAFAYYQSNENYKTIMRALPYSTASFQLHNEITSSMAMDFLPEEEAYKQIIYDFETDAMIANLMFMMHDFPEHYEELATRLLELYSTTEMWDEAFELVERVYNNLSIFDREQAYFDCMIYMTWLYEVKGDISEAIETLQKLKEYIEQQRTDDNADEIKEVLETIESGITRLRQKQQ